MMIDWWTDGEGVSPYADTKLNYEPSIWMFLHHRFKIPLKLIVQHY